MTQKPEGLSAYIAVTAAYWAFMLTDGALRMLVLLHFHTLGFSPVLSVFNPSSDCFYRMTANEPKSGPNDSLYSISIMKGLL